MPNKPYDNFFLANEIEDQYNSHLDLVQFCTVDNSLTGTAGMDYKVHVYKATDLLRQVRRRLCQGRARRGR